MTPSVEELSVAYQPAMRNIPREGDHDTCGVCHTFVDPDWGLYCYPCNHKPDHFAVVAPITYSEHLGQLHLALRNYKRFDIPAGYRDQAAIRLTAILWRYVQHHEGCIAAAAGLDADVFDLVTVVPSSDPTRDEHSPLRRLVENCKPVADRHERLLIPTGEVSGREYDIDRYEATRELDGESVLVVDDTWTAGGHAQSAGAALSITGAGTLGLIVIGRHLQRNWEPVKGSGVTCGDIFDELPVPFDWDTCVVHDTDAG